MARLQQRRVRFIILALLISIVLLYSSRLWSAPISVTWPGPKTPKTFPTDPDSTSTPKTKTSATSASPPTGSSSSDSQSPIKDPPWTKPIHPNGDDTGPLPAPLAPTSSAPTSSPTKEPKQCVQYEQLQRLKQEPLSEGSRKFPYSRPEPECRTFQLPSLEQLIKRMKVVIKDPDLFRLFENSYPNTLDTMIKWRGYANHTDPNTEKVTTTDEELAYVITGDIDAMWLRDSASQIYSYLPLLEASTDPDSLASLWRGVVNIHARYIIISPYCHSFQPPPESGVPPTHNGAYSQNHPIPPYDPIKVFDCKWELDSLASFLQISTAYYEKTKDLKFFQKYKWIEAVKAAVDAAAAMRLGTYSKEGKVEKSAWTFTGWTNRGSETLTNDGLGNPTKENGMVRTAFRPSDDACIYQLLVPANMMFAKYLEEASLIMEKLEGPEAKTTTKEMRDLAFGIRKGIDRDAIVHHRDFGDIYAYEIDGYGGLNLMDDANVPSLLSMPLFKYSTSSFPLPEPAEGDSKRDYAQLYNNTRNFVLSDANPYFMKGPQISAVGGPHLGPGKGWPMAAIVRAVTAFSLGEDNPTSAVALETEVKSQLKMVLDSTSGTGVVHESVNSWNQNDWTRAWFGWANGLLGELVLKIESEKPEWLGESWQ